LQASVGDVITQATKDYRLIGHEAVASLDMQRSIPHVQAILMSGLGGVNASGLAEGAKRVATVDAANTTKPDVSSDSSSPSSSSEDDYSDDSSSSGDGSSKACASTKRPRSPSPSATAETPLSFAAVSALGGPGLVVRIPASTVHRVVSSDHVKRDPFFVAAALLDPRYKALDWIPDVPNAGIASDVINKAKEMIVNEAVQRALGKCRFFAAGILSTNRGCCVSQIRSACIQMACPHRSQWLLP
jgi:hypothetical protein